MTARIAPPEAVVFDWDNTLVDSWAIIHDAMNATLIALGRESWPMAQLKAHLALSLRDSFPRLFGERWEEAKEVYYKSFREIHLQRLTPLPGAARLLDDLRDMGIKLSVLSNKNGDFLRAEAKALGWRFDHMTGATDASADKPDAAALRHALAPLGVAPSSFVWLVGDAAVDMECAVKNGCLPVLMREDPDRDGEFDLYPPVLRFDNCSALGACIQKLHRFE